MLFKKLWRTVGQYRAQFISMIVMIALGTGVFVGFHMEWVSIDQNMSSFFSDTGYADYRILSETGYTADDLAKVAALPDVRAAARYVAVNTDVKEQPGDSLSLTVTTSKDVSGVLVTSGEAYDESSTDGIWLSDKYAAANDVKIGDTLTFVYKNIEISGKVRGLIKAGEYLICVRDETQLMPDYTTYGFAYISPVMYENALHGGFYPQIRVISDLDKAAFSEAVNQALGKTSLILTKDESASYKQASGEIDEGKTMGSVLPPIFLLIAVLTMVTTMHRLTAKEKTQIGTLKALGFRDRRILLHYTSYAAVIGLIGSVFGAGLGYLFAFSIMNPNGSMGTYLDMPSWKLSMPWFCLLSLGLLIVLLTFIGYLSTREMLRGTAADALRPYTPKAMKPLLVEKTAWFHRLSFGTRWNMRDIMRHKSRTAMSFIGVFGCTLLIIASFGMRDTMRAFLDTYYTGATNYASRIYLATEGVTDEDRARVMQTYGNNYSASVQVELQDAAVSLDVYHVPDGKVRFPASDSDGFVTLGSDGVYVCERVAERCSLSVGDALTVSPYGTDTEYHLRVAGICRSITECIVMTTEYADAAGIAYTPDSVYTDTDKADIPADPVIRSVQAKQAIVDSFDVFTDIMDLMILILVGCAILLGIVVLYNLGIMSYTERYREMATLKVLGFRDRKIGRLLIGQNLWIGAVGTVFGLPVGIWLLGYMLKALAGEYEMRLSVRVTSFLLTLLLTLGMSLLVSFMVARKNRHIDMVEALKDAE